MITWDGELWKKKLVWIVGCVLCVRALCVRVCERDTRQNPFTPQPGTIKLVLASLLPSLRQLHTHHFLISPKLLNMASPHSIENLHNSNKKSINSSVNLTFSIHSSSLNHISKSEQITPWIKLILTLFHKSDLWSTILQIIGYNKICPIFCTQDTYGLKLVFHSWLLSSWLWVSMALTACWKWSRCVCGCGCEWMSVWKALICVWLWVGGSYPGVIALCRSVFEHAFLILPL